MSSVPSWILILQALLPPAIALAVGVIGFLQWRTAHQKVVLDLFDRRWKAAESIKRSLEPVFKDGRLREPLDAVKYYVAIREARLLFGSDVNTMLEKYKVVMKDLSVGSSYSSDPANAHHQRGAEMIERCMLKMLEFHDEFDGLCSRYMKMDQRLIRWPWTVAVDWRDKLVGKIRH